MKYLTEKILLCALFGALYFALFEISWSFDLVESYAPGISLVFLPAGVKLLAALISGFWGVLGTVIALAYVTPGFWPDQPLWFYVVYPALSGFSTLAVVALMKRMLGIDDDIRNLRFIHIPIIDLCATCVHGAVVNGFFALEHLSVDKDFFTRAFAMSVGDFLGSLILMLSFAVLAKLYDLHTQSVIRP
ncbi:hypothetical protein [Limnohabitans sp. MORI2]|uniref:hypothetical protein n=1 Tax=Limnohabitans sp. MORI2 TaxID=1751150 RepID=UPI002492B8AE|nr:hypothetical protein [Limnohabitans sp. MORI2]